MSGGGSGFHALRHGRRRTDALYETQRVLAGFSATSAAILSAASGFRRIGCDDVISLRAASRPRHSLLRSTTTFQCFSAQGSEMKTTLDKVVRSQKVVMFMKGTKDFPRRQCKLFDQELKNHIGTCSFPGLRHTRFFGSQIIMPFAHTLENEEV